jgi:hypothetical protein
MKTKTVRKKTRLSVKTPELPKKPPNNIFGLLLITGLVFAALCVAVLVAHYLISPTPQIINETIKEEPKDIEWFYNRSAELTHLKIRVDDIDNQTQSFIARHGPDESGYTPNEKDRIASLRGGLYMLKHSYNEKAAEYNSHAMEMNRSWNRSLPRMVYDIP